MENSIINKISSIIISEEKKDDTKISLLDYIDLMNYINNKIINYKKDFIKKANNKLSNNLAFFDFEIKSVDLTDNIVITINHELKIKEIIISTKTFTIESDLKNKEIFIDLIGEDLNKLVSTLKEYDYLNKISIKFKENDLNAVLNSKEIELFMHKSPNWITMGKAFSLKYYIQEKKFKYELDPISLEKSIKNQEKLLFSKLLFDKKCLPDEMQLIIDNYKNVENEKCKLGIFSRIINKIRSIVKK